MPGAVTIGDLADAPHALATVAEWQFGEWGFLEPTDSVGSRKAKLRRHLDSDRLPLTLVAMEGPEPVGSADLVQEELPDHADLGPWLSCVFVAPAHRRRGIGSSLTRAAEARAGELGFRSLYLCTWNREGFYRRLGWSVVRSFEAHGTRAVIMERAL